ncbi:MAG TPA: hypothetical protein PK619_02075, partial [bacterium]|nr:hypothetical protein [bacterium]
TGASGQTLRHDGSSWVANSSLYNNGTNIGIGTASPATKLTVYDAVSGPILTLAGISGNYQGVKIANTTGAEQWFSGRNSGNQYVIRRNGASDDVVVNTDGNVGIGVATPTSKLEINGNLTFYGVPGVNRYINPNTPSLGAGINLFISAGRSSWGKGGDLNLLGGEGNVGDGGDVLITAGQGNIITNSGNGGNIKINPGEKDGDGVDGNIYINNLRGNAYMGRASSGFSLTVLGNESVIGRLGINTDSPAYSLDVNGQMRLQPSTQPAPVRGVIYFDGTANKFKCSEDGTSFVDCVGSGGTSANLPTGASGQTLRHDGSSWVANSSLYNNGTNIGIGTAAPVIKLAIGDTDTGLQWISDGNLAVYTNNVERMRVNSAGNIGVGTTAPGQKLDVAGNIKLSGDLYFADSKSIRVDNVAANTTVFVGNYGDGGSFAYGSTPSANLAVEGDVKGDRLCIEDDCRDSWSAISNMPDGITNETLRYSGTSWVSSGVLVNNGTNVGIGTASPTEKLDVSGNIKGQIIQSVTGSNQGIVELGGRARISSPWTTGESLHIRTARGLTGGTGQIKFFFGGTNDSEGAGVEQRYFMTATEFRPVTNGGSILGSSSFRWGSIYSNGTIDTSGNVNITGSGNNYLAGNVGVGVSSPTQKLDVAGNIKLSGDVYVANGKSIRVDNPSNTNLYLGNYSDGSSFGYNTTYKVSLAVEGDIAGDRLCIEADCRDSWPSGLSGNGTNNYVAKFTGATALGNSQIVDNGTSVGIGTVSPPSGVKLSVISSVQGGVGISANTTDGTAISGTALGTSGVRVGVFGSIPVSGRTGSYAAGWFDGKLVTDRLCLGGIASTDCVTSFNQLGLPGGATNQTLRYNGISWEGSSVLINDGSKIGIGSAPSLSATANIRSASIYTPALMLTNSSYDLVWGTNETFRLGEWDGTTFTERLAIIDDGRVGLGVAAPVEALEIGDSATGYARVRITDTSHNPELQLQYGSTDSEHWGLYANQISGDSFNIWSYNGGSSGDRLTILQSGNVGIGTIDPSAKLDVNGSLRIRGITSNTTNSRIMTTDSSGNVTYRDPGSWAVGGSLVQTTMASINFPNTTYNQHHATSVYCPDSSWKVSGGGISLNASGNYAMEGSYPNTTNGWTCKIYSADGSSPTTATCYVVCIK